MCLDGEISRRFRQKQSRILSKCFDVIREPDEWSLMSAKLRSTLIAAEVSRSFTRKLCKGLIEFFMAAWRVLNRQ